MLKKSNFLYLIFLTLLARHTWTEHLIPNREMIILLETTKAEHMGNTLNAPHQYKFAKILHPTGIGAMSITLLHALYQKTAPIIANKALIKNIIDHQNLFHDFITLDRDILYRKYGRSKRFHGHHTLDNFITNCRYMHNSTGKIHQAFHQLPLSITEKNISKLVNTLKKDFNINQAPPTIRELRNQESAINALMLEMVVYTLCSWIDFKKDWKILQVDEDIFLLIPNDYLKTVPLSYEVAESKTTATNNKLTERELALGLKIDHMKCVERSFFEQTIGTCKEIPFTKSLSNIFVTQKDLQHIKGVSKPRHTWSLYMSGHGTPLCPQIGLLPQLHKLIDFAKKKLKTPTLKECLTYEKNQAKGLAYDRNHLRNCEHHHLCNEHIMNIKKLNKEIKKAQLKIPLIDAKERGLILSLPIDEFRNVLKFFNNEIMTVCLYYTSCFAGGDHYIEPYREDGRSLTFNYIIISGTPAENISIQEFPGINLPPYYRSKKIEEFEPFTLEIADIDTTRKTLKLHTTLHFDKYFESLRSGVHNNEDSLILIPYSLHPHIDKFGNLRYDAMPNIPLIRFAHSDHFQPIPGDNSSVIINEANRNKPISIDKNAALIYSDYIPANVTLNKIGQYQDIPQLFSMNPGFALHTFESITSSTLNFSEIINCFLTFPELGASKIFWIKKLVCQAKSYGPKNTETYKDVIIMRNVFNTNVLTRCSGDKLTPLENCAYFSNDNHKECKVQWKGPFIGDSNFQIIPWNKKNHKEECLHSFPHALKFLNPIMQTI